MKSVVEFNPEPHYVVISGVLGKTPVFQIRRVQLNGPAVSFKGYYFSKELQSVVSTLSGDFAKAKVLKLDKYRKLSLIERGANGFHRILKVSLDEIQHAASETL